MKVENKAGVARVKPPRISTETTYFLGPVDDEGDVDYVDGINRLSPFYGVDSCCNSFVGLLRYIDTSSWGEEYCDLLFKSIGFEEDLKNQYLFIDFISYANLNEESGRWRSVYDLGKSKPWRSEEFPVLKSWLDRVSPVLDAISIELDRPGYFVPLVLQSDQSFLAQVDSPDLLLMREIAESYAVRANYYLAIGEVDLAFVDVMSVWQLGLKLESQIVFPSYLIGLHIQEMGLNLFARVLDSGQMSKQSVRKGMAFLRGNQKLNKGLILNQLWGRVALLDVVKSCYRGEVSMLDFLSDNWISRSGWKSDEDCLGDVVRYSASNFEYVLVRLNRFYSQFVYREDDCFNELIRKNREREQFLLDLNIDSSDFLLEVVQRKFDLFRDAQLSDQSMLDAASFLSDLILKFWVSDESFLIQRQYRIGCLERMNLINLGCLAYRLDFEEYPDSLDELKFDYLESIPLDPFSDGQYFVYQKQGQGFMIYSLGVDGKDNAGSDVEDENGEKDIVLRFGLDKAG